MFALTLVIRFNFNEVTHNCFSSIIAAHLEFLETNESVVRVYYKTVTGKGDEVICFVVILFQKGFEQYREDTEEDWIRSQLSFYNRQEYHYTINIEVENWNKKFLYTTTSDSKTILNHSTFSNNSANYTYTLGFLFMLDNLESSIVLEEKAKDIFFKKVKDVNNSQRMVSDLLSSNKYNLWDIKHLSDNAQKYILNLFIVYKEFIFNEYLLSTEIKKTYELILKIETFMLSVQESSHVAFNVISDKKKARDFKPEWLDDLALRTFYQFISLLSYHKEIVDLYEFKYCSEFISKFLEVFQEQNGIENFLMHDLSYKIMRESENYITAFKCHDLYFNRRQGANRDYRESRFINIPIYQNRIIKIQDYIKYAFQKDCLVVCYEVTCSANSPVVMV